MRQIIKPSKQKALIHWLKNQGHSQKKALLSLSLLRLATFIIQLALFWQLSLIAQKFIVDNQNIESHQIIFISLTMLVIVVFDKVQIHLAQRTELNIFNDLQSRFFSCLSTGQYALTRNQSSYFWQQIWLTHIPAVAEFNVRYLVQQRFVMAVPFIILACVFPLNWLIGVSLIISLPIVPLFMIIIGKGASAQHQKHFKALTRLGSIFVDRIKSLRLLKIFDAHDKQTEILCDASNSLNQRTMRVVGVAFLSATVLDFFSTLAVALVAVFVGFNLLGEFTWGGQLTLHSGLFLLLAAPLCFAELKQLGRLYHLRAEAIAVAETLSPILDTTTDKNLLSTTEDAHTFDSINWQNFQSPIPQLSASKINFRKGDWIWLQGQSGSGKTCFLECLMGQRKSTHALKNAVLISQHAVILPTTIRKNITLGRDIDDERIYHALEQVELSTWLQQQSSALDTILSEQIPLSGGQQQRLALARILLIDAPVILLDEPTAHLTDEQHQRLSNMIYSVLADKTVIWASHKPLISDKFTHLWMMTDGELQT
ncbi:MAG: ATP-binding cassette domain-containing protein [Gammaproteobacteria bacterium]|nr:ATP-binding cassette domain-containing protein [Gammaproteobacteria bacterium]